jgi:cytoskeletal protein CcmA (bactofilin family)
MPASPRRTLLKPPPIADLPASRLGRASTVRGRLDTDGEVTIHGNVLGWIYADRLVLAADGYVEGVVVARDVRIEGRMNGRIFGFHVTLESSADMTGRIFHHTVTVAKGARVDGRMPWRPLNFFESFEQPPETES